MAVAIRSHVSRTVAAGTFQNVISPPTGTTNGDYLVAFASVGSSAEDTVAPAGWTNLGVSAGAAGGCQIYTKVASSEPSSYTFDRLTSTGVYVVHIVALTGVDTTTTPYADVKLNSSNTSQTSFSVPAATATGANTFQLDLLNVHNTTTGSVNSTPAGFTLDWDDATPGTATRRAVGGDRTVSAGSAASHSWGFSVSSAWRAATILLNPAAGAAGGSAALSVSASGGATAPSSGVAALALSASGDASAPAAGVAALSLSATGGTEPPADASGTASLSLSATGGAGVGDSGTASITLSASGAGTATEAASGTAVLSLSAAGSATLAAGGTAFLTLSADGTALVVVTTDTANAFDGLDLLLTASVTFATAVVDPSTPLAERYDKALPYPEPVMVGGRPT